MMKLERIVAEIEKTKETISKQQARLRELEAQKTEVENLQIVQMVRALRMTPAELSGIAVVKAYGAALVDRPGFAFFLAGAGLRHYRTKPIMTVTETAQTTPETIRRTPKRTQTPGKQSLRKIRGTAYDVVYKICSLKFGLFITVMMIAQLLSKIYKLNENIIEAMYISKYFIENTLSK